MIKCGHTDSIPHDTSFAYVFRGRFRNFMKRAALKDSPFVLAHSAALSYLAAMFL